MGNTQCSGGCDCDCGVSSSAGIVESWDVMMGAIELMRKMNPQEDDKPTPDEWDGEKSDWENIQFPNGGLGRGYSTLSKRIGQVRTGDWGMPGVKKRPGSIRKEEG